MALPYWISNDTYISDPSMGVLSYSEESKAMLSIHFSNPVLSLIAPGSFFYILLVAAMVTWGFAWPSGKVIAGLADSHVIIFWRFLLTSLSLVPLVVFTGNSFRLPGTKTILEVFLGGILYTIYNQFFLFGLELGGAGLGGVLVTTLNPVFTYLIVGFLHKRPFTNREILGLFLGFLGGAILVRFWERNWEAFFRSGNTFFLLCAFSWALLSINSHKTGEKISPIVYGFYVYTIGTIFDLLLVLAFKRDLLVVFELGWNFWLQIFYLAVVSTTFGTTMYFFASTRLGSKTASSFIFLVPVSALLGSWIFLNETPEGSTLLGGGVAMLAVFLLGRKKTEK